MLKRSIMLIAATDGTPSRAGYGGRTPGRAIEARTLVTWRAAQRLGAGRTTILRAGLDDGEVVRVERDLEWRVGVGLDIPIQDKFGLGVQLQYRALNSNIPGNTVKDFSITMGPTVSF